MLLVHGPWSIVHGHLMNLIKPYGDQLGDGVVQMSFTLPVPASPEARQAAIELGEKMGLKKILVSHMEQLNGNFTFFILYGHCIHEVDLSTIQITKRESPLFSFEELNEMIRKEIKRKLVVVGACIGSDAHTVGIDAIFNMKGFNHDWGFERYPEMEAHNLRAQVSAVDLVAKVVTLKADAVLVSRVVTQRDEHVMEFKKLITTLKENSAVPPHLIKICGGPRISHEDALSWGFDAGFGPGTRPSEVGSFIVHEMIKRGVT